MKHMKESIFLSAIRSFCNTLLGTIGIFFGFIPILIIVSFFSTTTEDLSKNKIEFLPNHLGESKILPASTPAVLQLYITGTIGMDFKAQDINSQLLESKRGMFRKDRVKAILLYINSPGGTVVDSDNIYRSILSYKQKYKVPVYAFVEGLCASGGMYIACSADKIYSSPVGLIGSVGVRMGPFFNVYNTMEKYGVKSETLVSGKDKDALNPFRKWKNDEDKFYQGISDYYYSVFIDIVSNSRKIDKNDLLNNYGAHVFDPIKAKEYKYIDEANMSYEDTLLDLIKEAKIDPNKPYQVATLIPKKNWLTPITGKVLIFFKSMFNSIFFDKSVTL